VLFRSEGQQPPGWHGPALWMNSFLPSWTSDLPSMNMADDSVVYGPPAWTLDHDALEVIWTVFRPGYLVAIFVLGWAMNVAVFGQFKVDYCTVLGIAKDEVVSPGRLIVVALSLLMAFGACRFALLDAPSVLAILWSMLAAYAIGLFGLFIHLPSALDQRFRWRIPIARALWRSVCPDTSREIPFVEVLVADGLTSLSKVFFDLAVCTCVASSSLLDNSPEPLSSQLLHGFEIYSGVALNSTAAIAGARPVVGVKHTFWGEHLTECRRSAFPYFAWSIPFLLRARQCTIAARHAPDSLARDLQRVNFLKYLTALPVIAFAFCYVRAGEFSQMLEKEDFEFMWALAAVLNSMFSFLWDLVMDWGLLQPGADTFGLRQVLLFKGVFGFYQVLILQNLIGRTLWSLRWSPQATLTLGAFLLGTFQQSAEVFRRCLWNLLRVEWECIKKGVHRVEKHFPV